MVVQSSAQDTRRLKRLEREVKASSEALAGAVQAAQKQAYFCRADAAAAAQKLRTRPSASHQGEGWGEERPKDGQGRPSPRTPRPLTERRYGRKAGLTEQTALLARQREAAACWVLLSHVPLEGALAHRAGEGLRADKAQQGVEHNCAFRKDPVRVNRLFLQKPARLEALGVVWILALMLWRRRERQRRQPLATPETTVPGGDKQATERPTSCMLTTTFAGLLGRTVGGHRQLARPLAGAQPQYLTA